MSPNAFETAGIFAPVDKHAQCTCSLLECVLADDDV